MTATGANKHLQCGFAFSVLKTTIKKTTVPLASKLP